MQVITWSDNQKVQTLIDDILSDVGIDLLDASLDISEASEFKITGAIKKYFSVQEKASADPNYATPPVSVRMAFSSDESGTAAKEMLALADHARDKKKNPNTTEQNVYIASYLDANSSPKIRLTGQSPFSRIDKLLVPSVFIDKTDSKHNNLVQINASNISSVLNTVLEQVSSHVKMRYIDFMIDPSTNTGIAAMALIGKLAEPPEQSEDGAPVTTSDEEPSGDDLYDFVICTYINAKFNMHANTIKDIPTQLELVTGMNRGLKGTIKAMSRLSDKINLYCDDLEMHTGAKGLHITLWAMDRENNKLESVVAQMSGDSITNEQIMKYSGKNIELDSDLIRIAIDQTKGDLSIGLSDKVIAIISQDTIAATAIKATAAAASVIETALEEETPDVSVVDDAPLDSNAELETMRVESHIDKATEELTEESSPRAFSEKISMDKPRSISDVPIGYGEMHTEPGEGGEFTVIEVSSAVAKGEFYECYLPTEKIVVKIAARFINCQDPVAPLRIKRGSITHRTLEVLESTPDRVYSSESLRECVSALLGTVKQPTFNAAIGKMSADGLIDRVSRGKYKCSQLAKYVLFETL